MTSQRIGLEAMTRVLETAAFLTVPGSFVLKAREREKEARLTNPNANHDYKLPELFEKARTLGYIAFICYLASQ